MDIYKAGDAARARGMIYGVAIEFYSLEPHCVGAPTGGDVLYSTHKSLRAAGRVLGSLIAGKRRRDYTANGRGVQLFVFDLERGRRWSRNDVLREVSR